MIVSGMGTGSSSVSAPNATHLLLRAFVDELARCGIAGACTSPGSRSTPIVLALAAEERIPTWSHVDERCAGFFALGVAKATGRPAAVACTSGTAAANFAPAVHEAAQAGVGLLVLTADRPAELRDVGAGQVIDQVKLFGDAVKWFVEVGTHDATPDRLAWMRALACRAVWTAGEGRPGPVHLNFPLREPLVLDEPLPEPAADGTPGGGRPGGRPWVARPRGATDSAGAAEAIASVAAAATRGVVGPRPATSAAPAPRAGPAAFAGRPRGGRCSPTRSRARDGPARVAALRRACLRHEGLARRPAPDVVLGLADLPTSKPCALARVGRRGPGRARPRGPLAGPRQPGRPLPARRSPRRRCSSSRTSGAEGMPARRTRPPRGAGPT
jgi:2-succinyl-5-enolpyruvyl-6-hydroxy-3-cyclohexene-1-carboxylate synthase